MSYLLATAINAVIDPVLKIGPGCFVECLNALYYQYSFWNTGPLTIVSVILAFGGESPVPRYSFRPNEICSVCHVTIYFRNS